MAFRSFTVMLREGELVSGHRPEPLGPQGTPTKDRAPRLTPNPSTSPGSGLGFLLCQALDPYKCTVIPNFLAEAFLPFFFII